MAWRRFGAAGLAMTMTSSRSGPRCSGIRSPLCPRAAVLLVAVLLAAVGERILAWDPYDTDSARAGGDYDSGPSPGDYRTPGRPRGDDRRGAAGSDRQWQSGWDERSGWYAPAQGPESRWSAQGDRAGAGWDRQWLDTPAEPQWRPSPEDAPRAPRDGLDRGRVPPAERDSDRDRDWGRSRGFAEPSSAAEPAWRRERRRPSSLYDDFTRERRAAPAPPEPASRWSQPQAPREPAAPRNDGSQWAEPGWDGSARYRFRDDPRLEGRREGGSSGWRFRPLTEKERERQRSRDRYPEFREQDYLPRGPWRSYEDEGTAFGYHPDARSQRGGVYRD